MAGSGLQPYTTTAQNLPQPEFEPWNRTFTPYSNTQYPWADSWRKMNYLNNYQTLNQRRTGIQRNLAQTGLDTAPGWQESLMNPAYQEYDQANLQGNAQVGQAEHQAWQDSEQMKRQDAAQKEASQYGLINGVLQALAMGAGFFL